MINMQSPFSTFTIPEFRLFSTQNLYSEIFLLLIGRDCSKIDALKFHEIVFISVYNETLTPSRKFEIMFYVRSIVVKD